MVLIWASLATSEVNLVMISLVLGRFSLLSAIDNFLLNVAYQISELPTKKGMLDK